MKSCLLFHRFILTLGILAQFIVLAVAGFAQAQGVSHAANGIHMESSLRPPADAFLQRLLPQRHTRTDLGRRDHGLSLLHGAAFPEPLGQRPGRHLPGGGVRQYDSKPARQTESTHLPDAGPGRASTLDLRKEFLRRGVTTPAADTIFHAWSRNYDFGSAPSADAASDLTVDSSGNVYVTGYSIGAGTSYDFLTIKYTAGGGEEWVARYNGPGNSDDFGVAVAVDGGGNVYVTGTSPGPGTANDCVTIKYNASGAEQWVARYNSPGNLEDGAAGIALDTSGNVYVTGSSADTGTAYDFISIKYNATGQEQWVARYNGPDNSYDFAIGIALDGAGNVYVTGDSYGSTAYDYATIKYNTSGAEQWVARYNGPGNSDDISEDIAVDDSGSVYVTGYGVGAGTANDYATVKYSAAGAQQWAARYNGPGNSEDAAIAVALDAAGNVYVTGYSVDSATAGDFATIKYNAAGIDQWIARYDGPGYSEDGATSIAVDGAGNVYVTGASTSATSLVDYATIKYNAAGTLQWVARYDQAGDADDVARAIGVDNSGHVYVTGYTYSQNTSTDYGTIRYDASGVQEWVARYDGPGYPDNLARAIALDKSGNVYVTGWSYASGSYQDYATIKYNAAGAEQWVARYNGPANSADIGVAIAVDSSENVYVTGSSTDSGVLNDYATVKYDASGVQQWVARYDGPGHADDVARAISIDQAGNVYVTGSSSDSGISYNYATVKYDGSGQEQWVARYSGPAHVSDYANDIAVDDSGYVYVTGLSGDSGAASDYATIKYNATGGAQWVARYSGPGSSVNDAIALGVDGAGNVYATGYSSGGGSTFDYATVKYNASGVEQWASRYNGPVDDDDFATDLAVDDSGNVYVTGQSIGTGYSFDYATIKYNASGGEQWVARYDGPAQADDIAAALAIDGSGSVYVTGPSGEVGVGYDYATVKYNAAGVEQWAARYSGEENSFNHASAVAVDGSGNVYVTGWSGLSGGSVYTTIKYEQLLVAVEEGDVRIPTSFALAQNYPNPFNPSTRIRFSVPSSGTVTLAVFDLLGQEVATLVHEALVPGTYERTFDAGGLAGGIYFYRLKAGPWTATKNFVLIR